MENTKGPWVYVTERDANGNRSIFAPDAGYTICVPMSHAGDAYLIASAPDMIGALFDIERIVATADIDSRSKELILNIIGKTVAKTSKAIMA